MTVYAVNNNQNINQGNIDAQLSNIEEQRKRLELKARQMKTVQRHFPDASYGICPDQSSGYICKSINAQTNGAVKHYYFSGNNSRFMYCFVVKVRYGNESLIVSSVSSVPVSTLDVLNILNTHEAKSKRLSSKELEDKVTVEVEK